MHLKVVILCITSLLLLSFVSADLGLDSSELPQLRAPSITTTSFNNATGSVNSTSYWGNYLYSDYNMPLINLFAYNQTTPAINYVNTNFVPYTGATGNVNLGNYNLRVNTLNVTGNIIISGNLSVKRPYWNGYDNSTQKFYNTANTQIINISNNNNYDSYLISIVGNQNITFKQTGDYFCVLSPQFFQNGGGSVITFWYQKNGVDVAWSNSRYTMSNNEYHAPAITYQFDIENPTTDTIRFMWWSDSTATQIYSSGALTSPTRPSIPGILLNCQKVSEIT